MAIEYTYFELETEKARIFTQGTAYSKAKFEIATDKTNRTFTVRFIGASTNCNVNWAFSVKYTWWIDPSLTNESLYLGSIKCTAPATNDNITYAGWWPASKVNHAYDSTTKTNHQGVEPYFTTANGSGSSNYDVGGERFIEFEGSLTSRTFKFDANGNPEKVYVRLLAENPNIKNISGGSNTSYSSDGKTFSPITEVPVPSIGSENITITAEKGNPWASAPDGNYTGIIHWKAKITNNVSADDWGIDLVSVSSAITNDFVIVKNTKDISSDKKSASGSIHLSGANLYNLKIKARNGEKWFTSNTLQYDLRKPKIINPSAVVTGSDTANLKFSVDNYKVDCYWKSGKNSTLQKFTTLNANGTYDGTVKLLPNSKESYTLQIRRTDATFLTDGVGWEGVLDTTSPSINLKIVSDYPIANFIKLNGVSDRKLKNWRYKITDDSGAVKSGNIYEDINTLTTEGNLSLSLEYNKTYTAVFYGKTSTNLESTSNPVTFTPRGGVLIKSGDEEKLYGVYIYSSAKQQWQAYNPYININGNNNSWKMST